MKKIIASSGPTISAMRCNALTLHVMEVSVARINVLKAISLLVCTAFVGQASCVVPVEKTLTAQGGLLKLRVFERDYLIERVERGVSLHSAKNVRVVFVSSNTTDKVLISKEFIQVGSHTLKLLPTPGMYLIDGQEQRANASGFIFLYVDGKFRGVETL